MYSTHNERKFVVAKRFISTLKNKIYKYMTLVFKNMYIDKSDEIVNKNNNTYPSTIKMKSGDVKSNICINFGIENNENNAKGYAQNWSEEVFMIKKVKDTVPWIMSLVILTVKKLMERFTKKNIKKQNKKVLG